MVLDLIQKPLGTLDILLYLSREVPSDVTTIIGKLGMCTSTFYSAVNRLKSLGLVFEETKKGWPTRVFYRLTYKGEEVVTYLHSIEGVISESIDAKKADLEKLESMELTQGDKERKLELMSDLQDANYDLGNLDETLRLSDKAIELASTLQDDHHLSHAYRRAGIVHQQRGETSKAMEYLNKGIQISSQMEDWRSLAESHCSLGFTYEVTGDFDSAHAHYQESYEFAQKAEWGTGEALARMGYGRVLTKRDNYQEALNEMQKATEIFEDLGDLKHLAKAYCQYGTTMVYQDMEKAFEYLERSIEMGRRVGDPGTTASGLVMATNTLNERGEFKKALEYLEEAEEIYLELDVKRMLATVYLARGCVHKNLKDWGRSEESFRKGIRLCEEVNEMYSLGDTLYQYGDMLIDKGDADKAEEVLRRALSIFKELGSEGQIDWVNKSLRSIGR
jgi:tetratricopeptide (TPR) repeat protein